ncbi:glycine zipper domain-containing protein [Sphingobacterium faecium]|uniref:glycine zipper domain-containing protein n=1 Tax=Sphingobacterium faecium TaxID=34087 RepID=UPI0024798A22|nr:glycine zipper domain-containing protein [Sphingobacterium faecium]WGQ12986.1 glycine zipper domain-containing protein [Sphingobacterium faecium]
MSDGQLDIEFRFNTPEAKRETDDIRKGVKSVNDEAKGGNAPLKEREGILERLRRRMAELKNEAEKANSVMSVASINKELQRYEQELVRVGRAGRAGFDSHGNAMLSNEGILQRLYRAAQLYEKGMLEATNPANLEKYSQKLGLINSEISKLTKGQNIGGSWNGLQNSVNQLTRELPAMTYGFQTFAMAISNNLPIFADEIIRIKKENEALIASGKKGKSVWKELGSALLSWQTAMMVGIVLMTTYGKEIGQWIKGLFNAKKEVDTLKEANKALHNSLAGTEYTTAVQNVKRLEIAVDLAKKGFVSKKAVVQEYNKTIGKTTGEVKTLHDVESFLIDNAQNYVKMTMYKAAANIALQEAAKGAYEAEIAGTQTVEDAANAWDRFLSVMKTGGGARLWNNITGGDNTFYDDEIQSAGEKRIKSEQDAARKVEDAQTKIAENFLQKASQLAGAMNISVFGDDPKTPKVNTTAIENAYKRIVNIRKEALEKIQEIDAEYRVKSFENDQQEIEALKQKFADLRRVLQDENKKIAEYNAKNKKSPIDLIDVSAVDPIEQRAMSDLRYRHETNKLSESLNERKKLVQEYEEFKTSSSEKEADKRFSSDLSKIKNYYRDVTGEINALQGKQFTYGLTGAETERLNKLLELLKEYNQSKQALEDKAFLESFNLTKTYGDKLADINEKYQRLYKAQGEQMSEEKKELLKQARQDEIDQLNETEARKNRILIQAAKQQLVITTAGIRAQIKVIKDLLAREDLTPQFRNELESALTNAQSTAKLGARAATLANLQKQYRKLADELVRLKKVGASAEEIKAVNDKLQETQEEIDQINQDGLSNMLQLLQRIAFSVSQLGESLSNLGDAFGNSLISNAGQFLSGLANGIDNLSVAFDKNATSSEKYAAAISSAVDLISMVANAAAERKQAEEEYYRAIIDLQREYNLSLNDQIRLQSQLGESIYLKDYVGRMKDGMLAAEDAIKNYQKAVIELSQKGKISKGLENAVDWKNVGSGAVSGAVIGATIGSVIPVIGTLIGGAVGAVVGFFTGLFGGKKKKPKYEDLYTNLPKEVADVLTSSEPQDLRDVKALLTSLNNDKAVDANTKQMIEGVLEWIEKIEEARAQIKEVVQELTGSLGSDMRNNLVEYFKQGESAALAMGKTVNKVLEDMMSQLLFSKAFDEIFKQFEDQLTDTLLFGEEGDVIDVFAQFLKDAGSAGENYYKWMEAAKEAAKQQGLDIFNTTSSSNSLATSGIERISEQTGTELMGINRAVYDLNKQKYQLIQKSLDFIQSTYRTLVQSLKVQEEIRDNTANTVTELKNAVTELKAINKNTGVKVTR